VPDRSRLDEDEHTYRMKTTGTGQRPPRARVSVTADDQLALASPIDGDLERDGFEVSPPPWRPGDVR